MARDVTGEYGKRERQIMEIVYRRGRATAAEVLADLPDDPTYSSVRGMLRHLEGKGHLRHERDGLRYVYLADIAEEGGSRTPRSRTSSGPSSTARSAPPSRPCSSRSR